MYSVVICDGCLNDFLLNQWYAIRKFQGIGTGECHSCGKYVFKSHLFLLENVETETVAVCPHCFGQIYSDGYKVIRVWNGSTEPKCTVCGNENRSLIGLDILKERNQN